MSCQAVLFFEASDVNYSVNYGMDFSSVKCS